MMIRDENKRPFNEAVIPILLASKQAMQRCHSWMFIQCSLVGQHSTWMFLEAQPHSGNRSTNIHL